MARRRREKENGASPRSGLGPYAFPGLRPEPGAQPRIYIRWTDCGAEPRLTSGGEAVG